MFSRGFLIENETPPACAGGIILGQAKLVLNLRVLDILYSVVSLPHYPYGTDKIPIWPNTLCTEMAFFKKRILLFQIPRRIWFYYAHNTTHTHLWWYRNQQMYMVSVVILFYEVYLWVVFVNFYQPFLKKSIYTRVEYLLTVFCHYHYMIVAVIHAITLFAILYFFHNRSIARRFRIVYIYLLTQVVLRSNHKQKNSTEYISGIFLCAIAILRLLPIRP